MSWASCWCDVRPSATALPIARYAVTRAVEASTEQRRHAPALRIFRDISPSVGISFRSNSDSSPAFRQGYKCTHICGLAKLFCILDRDHLDLDQETGIGERGDAENGSCRQVGLAAAEKLRVPLHEGLEIHRRRRAVDQKHLHLDHVGHRQAEPFQYPLDPVEHADGLGLD